jgi:type 1 glutamine amidotransferase|tara:strand:+ start:765 stop:1487 length:723 start_codon:yes stop_codon:yes gene_type:complete
MKTRFAFFALICLLSSSLYSQSSMEGKNVLIVYGGWKGHQPEVFAKKIASWLENQKANVILSESTASYLEKELMQSLDLVIQHITMSKMSNRESKGLRDAIARGVGLAGCHGGLGDSFRNDTEYQYMVGGQFVKHPGGQVDYKVTISNTSDPVTAGINDFNLKTEQYYMHYDPNIEILATTSFSGKQDAWIDGVEMPVVWKKNYGKGRVFYSALGHSEDIFDIPEVWNIMTQGIEWAVKL